MILFGTEHLELFNYIIHHFLQIEIFEGRQDASEADDMAVGDAIEVFMPKYLFREQYARCVQVFRQLFYWTEDEFCHEMGAFHEVALYGFLNYMSDLREDTEDLDSIYFDEKSRRLIQEAARWDVREDGEATLEEAMELYYNIWNYPDLILEDEDFQVIPALYNRRIKGDPSMENFLGINIDYFFDILPVDIQKKYRTGCITLTGEVERLLAYIQDRISHGSLYRLFWENGKPVNEGKIQVILENIMDAYFQGQEIDITREALLGTGQVDFKLYRDHGEDGKILIEIKKADSPALRKGYEKQLTEYMLSSRYKNSFYLIACFTDEEYERADRFIREHIYTDTVQLYINIAVLDLRIRKTASKM